MSMKDRKALLRSSVKNEEASVEKRLAPADIDKRFEAAEEALLGRPLGLVGPRIPLSTQLTEPPAAVAAAGQGKEVIRVPIEHAHDNPLNARHFYDPEEIKRLAASLATRGQLVPAPAIAHPTWPGQVLLLDGHYRKRALLAAGKTEIECVMQEIGSEIDLYRLSYLINVERNSQTTLDNALAWKRLLDEKKVADGEGIAELIGVSAGTVTRTLSLLKLPKSAFEKLEEHPAKFGVGIGYELYRISNLVTEEELLALMDRVVAEDLSQRALLSILAKLEEAKPRKKKEVSRQYKIHVGDIQIGYIKEWDSGKVVFEVKLAEAKDREALVEELKRRFTLSEPTLI